VGDLPLPVLRLLGPQAVLEAKVEAMLMGGVGDKPLARRDELAALPQREAQVTYEHDDDSPTVRDHWPASVLRTGARSCGSGGCRSSWTAPRQARSATG
jgi:hypothetical protein